MSEGRRDFLRRFGPLVAVGGIGAGLVTASLRAEAPPDLRPVAKVTPSTPAAGKIETQAPAIIIPTPPEQTSRISEWPGLNVPNVEGIGTFPDLRSLQRPNIGFTEMYLLTFGEFSPIVVACFFDAALAKSAPASSAELGVHFQPAYDPFRIEKLENLGLQKTWTDQQGMNTLAFSINQLSQQELTDRVGVVTMLSRPTHPDGSVLIFEAGVVDYKGKPSPESYLAARFKFSQTLQQPNVA